MRDWDYVMPGGGQCPRWLRPWRQAGPLLADIERVIRQNWDPATERGDGRRKEVTNGAQVKAVAIQVVLAPPARGLGAMAHLASVGYYSTVMQITVIPIKSAGRPGGRHGGAG